MLSWNEIQIIIRKDGEKDWTDVAYSEEGSKTEIITSKAKGLRIAFRRTASAIRNAEDNSLAELDEALPWAFGLACGSHPWRAEPSKALKH